MISMLCAVVALSIGAAPAAAADPLDYVVHTEHVQVGPYPVTVGFTVWPLRAMQSLDFTFEPDGGIAGKSGTITAIAPDGREDADRLSRHPRNREVWGLDVESLDSSGTWTLRFKIDGPQGEGTGDPGRRCAQTARTPIGAQLARRTHPVDADVGVLRGGLDTHRPAQRHRHEFLGPDVTATTWV